MRLSKLLLLASLALVSITQACTPPPQPVAPMIVTVVVTAVPTPTSLTVATETVTPFPTPSPTPPPNAAETTLTSATPSATAGPQCTVLKAVTLRGGPGTAYTQVLGTFAPGTILIPTGYNPVGSPGGAWLQVTEPSKYQAGWISAAPEFVECTIALASLHAVAVQAPPPPPVPVVSNLPAQGPKGGDIDFEVSMSSTYLMRILARKHGSSKDGDGIDHVLFIVKNKNNEKVYSNSETNAKFCIFQGGEPDCNPWPKSNGRYVWGASGAEILSGDYQVTIRVALKTDPTNESEWTFTIKIKLP